MHNDRGRELRRCTAITLNGYGQQCRNFSNIGSNLCSVHLAADNRGYPDEATKAFNKVVSKKNRIGKKKTHYLRCQCQAYPFVHPAGGGRFCQWPFQPKQRLECKTDLEAVAFRRKLRRKGITLNTFKEKIESGIGEDSRIVDLDFDPSDLSLEEEYLSKIQYETDVLSLPIEERRKIQKQRMVAEYMLKIGKADIDGIESNCQMIEDDGDWVEIGGEIYKIG
jgi:hypothetical protein